MQVTLKKGKDKSKSGGGKAKSLFAWDRRVAAWCAYCGGVPSTRDHVPSRVLLDEPHDRGSPFVGSCFECNNGLSAMETYVACLVDCAIAGTADPDQVPRLKVRQALKRDRKLAEKLANARYEEKGRTYFSVDDTSVRRVLLKLVRGHVLFELNEKCESEPSRFVYAPLETLAARDRSRFEAVPPSAVWPEVNSRAMQRLVVGGGNVESNWVVMQPGRYRYATALSEGITVRVILSEYLGCEAIWSS